MSILQKVRAFIEKNISMEGEMYTMQDDLDIFNMGFVNSLFALRIVTFVESEFEIQVLNEDLDIANFNSVNSIVNFVVAKGAS